MTLQVGTYHFGRHRSNWGIWQCEYANNGNTSSRHIKDVFTYEEAVKEVYRLRCKPEVDYGACADAGSSCASGSSSG